MTPSPSAATTSPTAPPTSVAVQDGEPWIVYQGSANGPAAIRLIRPDGSGDHALSSKATGEQLHPDWSHDGTRVAFSADGSDGTRDIWVATVDGESVERIMDCAAPCGWADDPAWAPDDRSIMYQQGTAVGSEGIGVGSIEAIDLDTRKTRTLFTGAETEYAFTPRWAPDGRSIVLELDRFDSARLDASVVVESTIGVVDLAGPEATFQLLMPWDSKAAYPDWHPVDDRIVFSKPSDSGGGDELFVIATDGTGIRQVGEFGASGGRAIQPTWTPDGTRIVFVMEDVAGVSPNAATVLPDGSGLDRVPYDQTLQTHPRSRPTP
jgi:Tol biopolymer transport system component